MYLSLDIVNREFSDGIWIQLEKLVNEYENLCSTPVYFQNEQLCSESEDGELSSLEDSVKTVSAILKVAAAHTTERIPHEKAFFHNRKKLSALQVQIDPRSHDDEKAAELFHEAYGQLNWLNNKISERRVSIENEQKRLREERDMASRINAGKRQEIMDSYNKLLNSNAFADYLQAMTSSSQDNLMPLLGHVQLSLPLPAKDNESFKNALRLPCFVSLDSLRYAIRIPICVDLHKGGGILFESKSDEYRSALSGSSGFILNILSSINYSGSMPNVAYVDPVTYSPITIGDIAVLSEGDNPVIADVPRSPDEMRAFFSSLESKMFSFDSRGLEQNANRIISDIFIFRDYPQSYDSAALALIRKLILMAREYGILVILEGSQKTKGSSQAELLEEAIHQCLHVYEFDDGLRITVSPQEDCSFQWAPMPLESEEIIEKLIERSAQNIDDENNYRARIGASLSSRIAKGNRTLSGLPIGLSDDGEIINVAFEDENFAAFICGAARSGKSTFLHTLLTSIFTSKHPDDVEVWLVDFKMTEFSRYTASPPPHVRYIILDESPELVYDLLDRLTEVMSKRQALFKKNGWVKLSDAQAAGRYMPALFVVIDEFSVMSKIIADSALAGKDYKDKLQMLLAKGAALGFRFVFASQGFTQGTRGLSEFSKKQIQQRIAMKTDYAEIKDTLDLPSVASNDRKMMEGLTPHYALLNVPNSSKGRISKAHVLYFEDAQEQSELLAPILSQYKVADAYDLNSFESYISKKPQVFDGNELIDYSFVDSIVDSSIGESLEQSYDPTAIFVCVGQPTRMKEFIPIELVRGFAENLLLVVPAAKGEAFQSIVATIARSLQCQQMKLNIIVPRNTPLMPNQIADVIPNLRAYFGTSGLESFVRERQTMCSGSGVSPEFTIVLNPEAFLEGGSGMGDPLLGISASFSARRKAPSAPQTREENEDDFMTKMRKGELEVDVELLVKSRENIGRQRIAEGDPGAAMRRCSALFGLATEDGGQANEGDGASDADPEAELLKLLENGSKQDEHFMLVTSNAKELKKYGVSFDWCRHRLSFRMAQEDARELMSRSDAGVVAELDGDSFRYTNGLDSVTFRPYSHSDIGILVEDSLDDIDEYLL